MPINKADPEILRKNRVPYEIVPRSTVQRITNPDALAIWIYLLTKPDNWTVRKAEIKTHFSIGEDRYGAAMRHLREAGLVVSASVSDGKTGKLQGRVIWVNADANLTEVPEKPYLGENRISGIPEVREISTLKDTERELKKQRDPASADASAFAAFWEAYPKKVDKKKAAVAFRQLNATQRRMAIADIKAGRYAGTERQFVPNPTTYLRGERWEDESSEQKTQNHYAGAI